MSCLVLIILLLTPGCSTDLLPTKSESLLPSPPNEVQYQSRLAEIQARGVLRVGTAITEPFEYHDPKTDALIGFDVDTAQYIADAMGVELEWIEMSFANLIPALQDRDVDMTIAAMYIRPEREELVDFSQSYINTGLVMVASPTLYPKIQSVQDLGGLKVGVKIGATGATMAQDLISSGITLVIVEFKDTFDSFLNLEVGRVDVIFNDFLNSLAYIKDTNANLEIITGATGEIIFLSHAELGIAVHQGDQELLDVINSVVQEMEENGSFDRLKNTWLMPFDE